MKGGVRHGGSVAAVSLDSRAERRTPPAMKAWAGALLAGVMVGGCASLDGLVSETVAEAVVPGSPAVGADGEADWVEYAPDALPSTDWIAQFDDPSLNALVARGAVRNPQLLQSAAQLESALARVRIDRGQLYPALSADFRASRNEGGTGFFAGRSNYDLGLSTSWEADIWGRLRDQVDADLFAAEASAADLAGVRLSVASQIAQSWFGALEADQLVSLSRRDIDTQERILRLTERRFESGVTGASDVRLARSALSNSEALFESRLQARDRTVRALQTLVRLYPDAELPLPETLPTLPPLRGAGSPEFMLRARPDVIAAEARIAEAGLNVDVARKALLPALRLSGGVAEQATSSNGFDPATGEENSSGILSNFLDIFDLSEIAYNFGAGIAAPLFQGGALDAQVDAQRAQLAARLEAYAQNVLTGYEEVENALDAEERLRLREDALREALDNARSAQDRLRLRYSEGLATILQLLDAQNRVLSSESQLINAQAERLQNRVRLHTALGGGQWGEVVPVEVDGVEIPLFGEVGGGDVVGDGSIETDAGPVIITIVAEPSPLAGPVLASDSAGDPGTLR